MSLKYSHDKCADGIYFTSIVDKRLKTNTVGIHMITQLDKESAALNAIIPIVISDSNRNYPTFTELNKKVSSLYGSVIKGAVSKKGDSQIISLVGSCIADKYALENEKITDELTEILVDCLINPNVVNDEFDKKDFETKKQELLDDIYAEINDKRSYSFKRASINIFEGEPAQVSAKGEISTAEAINPEDAYKQYLKMLRISQIEIVYVGESEPDNVKSRLCSALNHIQRDFKGDNYSELSKVKEEVRRVTERVEVIQSKMVMALKTDNKNKTAIKLFNAILGGTPFSKLFLNVREKLSLCYYCSSGYNDTKGVLYIDSGVEKENIEKAQEEILNQIKAVQNGDFTDEDMINSKLAIINSWRGVNDSPRSLADWYFNQAYYKTSFTPEDQIEELKKVTREDVIAVANTFKLDTVYVLTGKEN